jgi:Fur family ferric uptake transcriptional regulator
MLNSKEKHKALHERLDQYMAHKGLRSTGQRRLVTQVFFKTGGHQSIEELLSKVRSKDPKVGYATVYRTLKLLVESGIAAEHHFGDGFTRYEITHLETHHDHLICTACGMIVEFEEPGIERLQDDIAKRHGFSILSHKHELYGRCKNCQRKAPRDASA